jgi:hypothetical protein
MKLSEKTNVNSFYTIASGLFRYDSKEVDESKLWDDFINWRHRINKGDYQSTFDYLNHSYYDSYLNNIFPEIRFDEDQLHSLNSKVLNHLTHKKCLEKSYLSDLLIKVGKDEYLDFKIEYIDLYLFPHDIGIFTMKVTLKNEQDLKLGKVSSFLNQIRNLSAEIILEGETTQLLKELIRNEILKSLNVEENWTIFNPQLKLYTLVDLQNDQSDMQLDEVLFDLGNMSPIGSAGGASLFSPSESYYSEQIQNNRISVFQNWTALALYDTFTRVSVDFPDNFSSWENDYFNLHIHTIYSKFFMYLTNSELSDVTKVDKRTEVIRDRFIEFVNDYQHTQISYKFLPDLIRDKLLYALGIQSEIERMDVKIQRINEQFQEKREKSFNTALVVITLLSVFSVIYDLSEWSVRMGIERSWVYPVPSIISGLLIFALIFLIFKIKRR